VKRRKISISPYILVPTIFSGISLLVVIVTYHVVTRYSRMGADPVGPVFWLSLASVLVTFVCTYLIFRFILLPILHFVKTAKTLPVMSRMPLPETADADDSSENIEELHRVLNQVTAILNKVEARELFPGIIGQSRVLRAIFGQILKLAPTDTTALISGESGTGKELVATAIYEHSRRREKPFVKVNCVAIPEGLLESELFGHEKGAFTGAVARKKGKFELADGGTIFLDEIGDMPPATQAKILRVLQEREFERVGGAGSIHVDVRIIAATNKNLTDMVKTGAFREDLFYRLNVFNIHLPALRERREDIPLLTAYFLGKMNKSVEVSQKVMKLLLSYNWPGNIRELQNVVERAAVMAEEGSIETGHLPADLDSESPVTVRGLDDARPLDDRLADIEQGMIIEALSRAGGIQARAAQILGINQRSLWHRIKKFNIDVSIFKKP
jgi:transcriptional regulator with PAS, ATPase and Fis domain